eukprot:3044679-Lingulodinium_polyedra.AAC.1
MHAVPAQRLDLAGTEHLEQRGREARRARWQELHPLVRDAHHQQMLQRDKHLVELRAVDVRAPEERRHRVTPDRGEALVLVQHPQDGTVLLQRPLLVVQQALKRPGGQDFMQHPWLAVGLLLGEATLSDERHDDILVPRVIVDDKVLQGVHGARRKEELAEVVAVEGRRHLDFVAVQQQHVLARPRHREPEVLGGEINVVDDVGPVEDVQ